MVHKAQTLSLSLACYTRFKLEFEPHVAHYKTSLKFLNELQEFKASVVVCYMKLKLKFELHVIYKQSNLRLLLPRVLHEAQTRSLSPSVTCKPQTRMRLKLKFEPHVTYKPCILHEAQTVV